MVEDGPPDTKFGLDFQTNDATHALGEYEKIYDKRRLSSKDRAGSKMA